MSAGGGVEATQALPSQFAAREVDEPVTNADPAVQNAEIVNELTNRLITIGGIGVAAFTVLVALFT